MADSNKNILITPATGTTSQPTIEFAGYDVNSENITLNVLDDGTLSIEGSSGQLFSIADSLSGTIFSVNDVSGIPSIEVDDDGTVRIAEFSGNMLIGTNVDNVDDKLQVNGSISATSISGAIDYADITNPPTVGNGTLTISSGSGLSGSGTFTANQTSNGTITLSHGDTSSQGSVNNSGRTYIQDITLDGYGHITGITSATETVVNTDNYVDSVVFNDGTGILTLGRTGALADLTTSLDGRYQLAGTYNTVIGTDTDLDTSGATIIDNIYVTDGVITSMGTRTLTPSDIGAQPSGNYLTTTTTFSGDVSGTYNSIVVADDSHNHSNYLPLSGGTIAGDVNIQGGNLNVRGGENTDAELELTETDGAYGVRLKYWGASDNYFRWYTRENNIDTEVWNHARNSTTVNFLGDISVAGTVNGRNLDDDGNKLDGIEDGANYYSHPLTHPATMITTTDEFTYSNSTNVQDVLDDLDQALQGKQASGSYVTTTDNQALHDTDALRLNANQLYLYKGDGTYESVDLSLYLDDTNLARLVSGSLNGSTGIATFTRDDASTFTVDFSALFDDTDTNDYVDSISFNTGDGVLTLGRTGALANLTVDLDGRYAYTSHSHNYVSEGGTDFTGTYPLVARISTNNIYSNSGLTYTGSTDTLNAVNIAVSGTVDGRDVSADGAKLDGIATGANNYTHPSTHPATMITTTDEFTYSNSTNVQDVLDDLDQAIANVNAKDPIITLTGDVSGSGTMTNLGNVSITTTVADDSHNHTSLTGVTSISFAAEASDSMSISRTINGNGTYFDFNLSDDNNNDWWRWRFTPSGSTVYDAMVLKPVSNGNADLTVSGQVNSDQFNGPLNGNASTATWADTVDVNTSTSTSTYGILWNSGDTVYTTTSAKIRPSDSAIFAPIYYDIDNTSYYMNPASTSNINAMTMAGDLTVNGGDIVLGGTGRIQGIDSVIADTDAVNKSYVDNAVATYIGTTPPSSPSSGDTWWNSEDGKLKIYYNDGDSSQWVDAFIGINGIDGTDGTGWTGGSYNSSTGAVTFTSNDGLGFSTGDLRGADGADGTNGTDGVDGYTPVKGIDYFDGTNGTNGLGWTGGSYNASTGVVTFTSNDGLGFSTGDLRGADGTGGGITTGKAIAMAMVFG